MTTADKQKNSPKQVEVPTTDIATAKPKTTPKQGVVPRNIQLLINHANERDHTASQYQLGKVYFEGDVVTYNFNTAKGWLEKASEKGHLDAQYTLGLLHEKNGDTDEARTILKKALDKGHNKAQYALGMLTLKEGKNEEAKELLKQSSADNPDAQCELGKIYFAEQNYREALEWLTKASSKGNLEATHLIAIAHIEGKGVDKSDRFAKEWLIKAADAGYAESQYRLGQFIYIKDGNIASAKVHLEKAAKNYHADSQYLLWKILLEENQPELATDWLIKAADGGHTDAQYTLATMYFEGNGVDKNIGKANELMQDAALKNHPNATYLHYKRELEECKKKEASVLGRFGIWGSATPNIECIKNLIPLLSTLADKNHSDTQYMLGTLYLDGKWIEQNYTAAKILFTKAAANDHIDAQFALGNINFYGNGTTVNYGIAKGYFEKAAAKNNTNAQCMLGKLLYGNYDGIKQDFNLAREQFIKSAADDKVEAKYWLGMMNFEGHGFKQNYTAAMEWFSAAAEAQHEDALYMQGMLYFDGKGVEQNYEMARECFEKAGKEHADAFSMLLSHSELLKYDLDDL